MLTIPEVSTVFLPPVLDLIHSHPLARPRNLSGVGRFRERLDWEYLFK
jgi:hypothetical protein